MKKNTNKRILFTGSNGFPFGSAVVQRQAQLANALLEVDYKVTVINTRGYHPKSIVKRENIKVHGNHQGVEYLYCSLLPFMPKNFLLRNIFKIIGYLNLPFVILYYTLFKNTSTIFNNSIELKSLKYYYFLAKIFNLQLIYDYVELIWALSNRDEYNFNEVNNSFDNRFYKYTDKVISISDFLERQVEKVAPDKPKIKIPPIINFLYFDTIVPKTDDELFFLFCGSAAYDDIIKFIIDSYVKSIAVESNYKLVLVLNGNDKELNVINKHIAKNNCEAYVKIKTKLSYKDLVCIYKSARALLIPIGNNIQDQARFPFKICEYTASKRPIITSASGSVKEFFNNRVNAFIAKVDDLEDFTSKINLVVNEPELANQVGLNGYNLGKEVFNYKTYAKGLKSLLDK